MYLVLIDRVNGGDTSTSKCAVITIIIIHVHLYAVRASVLSIGV